MVEEHYSFRHHYFKSLFPFKIEHYGLTSKYDCVKIVQVEQIGNDLIIIILAKELYL
jgi:hypothetical protein